MTKEELEIDNKRLDFNEKVQLVVKEEELKEQDIRLNKLCFEYQEKDRQIEELEKENAELRKKNLDTQDAVTMQMYTNKANKEIADKQLTKAKEIIRELINMKSIYDTCKEVEHRFTTIAKAEQFISEVEK